jgi:hypothetical protein
MKLDGSWYISVAGRGSIDTHPDATDVEIMEIGNFVRFMTPEGRLIVTNATVYMRTNVKKKKAEGD